MDFLESVCHYKIEDEKSERGYLTQREVEILMNWKLDKKLEQTRDVFIFCCFSGLSYIDTFKLTKEQLIYLLTDSSGLWENGRKPIWIILFR
ncbi:hypothetical protein CHFL109739_02020 [Chryseobacterium flavum]